MAEKAEGLEADSGFILHCLAAPGHKVALEHCWAHNTEIWDIGHAPRYLDFVWRKWRMKKWILLQYEEKEAQGEPFHSPQLWQESGAR